MALRLAESVILVSRGASAVTTYFDDRAKRKQDATLQTLVSQNNTIKAAVDLIGREARFEKNSDKISPDQQPFIFEDAETIRNFLRAFPNYFVSIEGYSDEPASEEYNIGLADRRADAGRILVEFMGVPRDRITTMGYSRHNRRVAFYLTKR